jgi:gamma-glutamyltranspeptidase/glutathione hydrolase
MSTHAMVSSAHPLATQAGLSVLQRGGNAADAAIAVNAVLNVTQPQMCGLGGDLFALVYDARKGEVRALNGSGHSPFAADWAGLSASEGGGIPRDGVIAANVPGCLDAWLLLREEYGSLPLAGLLEPAIGYAREGIPVSVLLHEYITSGLQRLRKYPSSMRIICPDGGVPAAGSALRQPDLAQTLQLVAEGGRDAFYEGPLARRIADYCREHGGLLAERDFREHHSEWARPIETTYRGYRVLEHPPNSQGFALLAQLNLAELLDVKAHDPLSSNFVHLLVEIKKIAFSDRDAFNTDPRSMTIAVEELISKARARKQFPRIDPARAHRPGAGQAQDGDTTYFCVRDRHGNAVSCIQSIFHSFGCGEAVEGTGLFLQNRMSAFSLDPRSLNRLEPHKRTAHTLNPAMVFQKDKLAVVLGTMGGDGQTQTLLQILIAMLDFGYSPQEALELPRWRSDEGMRVVMENRFPEETYRGLSARGHEVERVSDWWQTMGHAHVIREAPGGILIGAADPRGDGVAGGY